MAAALASPAALPKLGKLEYGDKQQKTETMMSDDKDAEKDGGERRTKLVKAGVAVGIGSAAIVAALLYASKVKKPGRGGPKA